MIGAIIPRGKTKAAFAALNRRDAPAHLRDYSDEATYVFPGEVSASRTFQGKKAIEGWFARFFEQFRALRFNIQRILVENILAMGGTNTIAVEWDFAYTNRNGTQGTNRGMAVISLRAGKIQHVRLYLFNEYETQNKAWQG